MSGLGATALASPMVVLLLIGVWVANRALDVRDRAMAREHARPARVHSPHAEPAARLSLSDRPSSSASEHREPQPADQRIRQAA